MAYDTIDELKAVERELADVDRLLDQESDVSIKAAINETAAALGAGGAGATGGGIALYFAGVVGFSGAGITSGLAAIGALVGGGMLAGIGILVAGPLLLAGGGYLIARSLKAKKIREARDKLRQHAVVRRDFLKRLVQDNQNLSDQLAGYRFHLDRLNRMIDELA